MAKLHLSHRLCRADILMMGLRLFFVAINMQPELKAGYQNAIPPLIFDRIFRNSPPGILWITCPLVCKSWRENIENGTTIIHFSTETRSFIILGP